MTELDGHSLDIVADNLQQLRALFPGVFTENELDWEKLKATFGNKINFANERYVLNWAGKADAFRSLQQPTTATLCPVPEESINFDTAEHVFIEGENLEVLKVLQKSYYSKVKCIVIDPPYNTGSDSFVYQDNYKETKTDYEKRIQTRNETGILLKENLFQKNNKDNGHFHSNWLSMIYSRLFLAKNLLRDDGLIFVHIDDNEVHNLKLLLNEIYGEENFIGSFCWRKKAGAGADSKLFFRQHEYILLYAKNIGKIKALFQPLTEKQKMEYKNPDNDPRGNWAPTDLKRAGDNDPKRIYTVVSPAGETFEACWSYTKENFKKLEENNLIWWGKTNKNEPKRKRFLKDKEGLTPRSWIDMFLTSDGTKDLEKLNLKNIFDYPKPVGLIKQLLQIGTESDSLIMDFFGGSGTTGQAVVELNEEESSKRKFIIIQIPEIIDNLSEAYKAGYRSISAITKKRIDVSLRNIKKNPVSTTNPGFKFFQLSASNFKTWQTNNISQDNFVQQLDVFAGSNTSSSNILAVLYEILLKSGYALTETIQSTDKYYLIGAGALIVTLETIDSGIVNKIISRAPKKVITLDSLFNGNDELKTNTALKMRAAGIDFKTL